MPSCIFCTLPPEAVILQNDLAVAIYDKYPVNPGHVLVIPRRHFPTFFEATDEEILAVYRLIKEVRALLDEQYKPDGYNIGVNNGACAGQTVWHMHVHVIPRFTGDVDHPRGGVRRVKPNLAASPAERP
ncbi:MAG TPA: HIT family protein [Peptococcaceae bacterium]|nr:HIT family protein [Peptococcaceae bacterium]